MTELIFTFFGFLLGLLPQWFNRKRRLKTHWSALRAEIILCEERANELLKAEFMSPLYRLPILAYQVSYPVVLADGAVTEEEVMVLGRFFEQVQDINRGLDNAAQAKMNTDDANLKSEFKRNLAKAERLVRDKKSEPSLFALAKDVIDNKISIRWWQFSKYS